MRARSVKLTGAVTAVAIAALWLAAPESAPLPEAQTPPAATLFEGARLINGTGGPQDRKRDVRR